MPEPLLPIAVEAATRGDEDALAKALARLTAGDPTVRVERHADTGQLVLWCLGEAHADVVLERLRATGAHVDTVPLRIALRETFTDRGARARPAGQAVRRPRAVRGVRRGRHPAAARVGRRSSSTRSWAARCPSQFIGSVEKGVRAQLEQGLDGEHIPVADVLVTLLDGKAHSVDSSDAAFQHGRLAGGARTPRPAARPRCSSRSPPSRSSCPTRTSARCCRTCPAGAAG